MLPGWDRQRSPPAPMPSRVSPGVRERRRRTDTGTRAAHLGHGPAPVYHPREEAPLLTAGPQRRGAVWGAAGSLPRSRSRSGGSARPPGRGPGPPCPSDEDVAGEIPHPAGLLGAGNEVPSLRWAKEVILLTRIYIICFFPLLLFDNALRSPRLDLLRDSKAQAPGRKLHFALGVFWGLLGV